MYTIIGNIQRYYSKHTMMKMYKIDTPFYEVTIPNFLIIEKREPVEAVDTPHIGYVHREVVCQQIVCQHRHKYIL